MGSELLLSSFIQVLFERLASPELLLFARQEGFRKQLDKLSRTLKRIPNVLDDAEEKQHTQRAVKLWLDDLRDLAYDVEDILDEFATEAALRRNKSQASTSMVRNLIPSFFTALTPSAVRLKSRLESKMKEITYRFNDLMIQKDQMNLKDNSMRPNKIRVIRFPTTSLVNEDCIYGRERERQAMVELLVSQYHGVPFTKVTVIPILGMGGIGKTTLAQLVYNDVRVQQFYELRAWACVSEDFDIFAVTKTILQSVTSKIYDNTDLNWLQLKLKENLLGKRFLVILDDVWNENYNDWVLLRGPFEAGAPGSSIVITTRNQGVASLMGTATVPPFHLGLLSNHDCWSIFSLYVWDTPNYNEDPEFQDLGKEIVRRCNGLPLATKTVGGLLRGIKDYNGWEMVLKNNIWNISENRSGLAPALMLSYYHLPSYLKRCFAYCSILPNDYEFEEKELVLLWMAEGLIQPLQHGKEMEDLGTDYFQDLLSRSLFQQSRMNKSRFFVHDLISYLAQSVAGDTCFIKGDRVGGSKHENIPIKARHSSYLGSKYDVTEKFEVFFKLKSLRTFLPLMLPNPGNCYLTHRVPLKLVPTLRCLRVLSLNGYCITKLSDYVGDLKHLRYLDLSKTQIRSLPESIATLYKLQTLLLKDCTHLKKLPSMLCNLVNLRHLNIEGSNSLEEMPVQIGQLTCLQTLSNLVVGKDNYSGIKELGPLKYLKGTLHISGLENVIELKDAKGAELITKVKIIALSLEWSKNIDKSRDGTSELEILNGLRPHDALEELVIRYYGGPQFPIWLTRPSFSHMVTLTIGNCEKCTSLPLLGELPKLKFLSIQGMASVKSVGQEFCGQGSTERFRSLRTLSFMNMEEWENWSPCEMFPKLHHLSLIRCPKLLGKLPKSLPKLKSVEINDCRQLVVSVSSFPDQCKIVIDEFSEGVVCGSKLVTFESIRFYSFQTISELTSRIEGFDHVEGLANLEDLSIERFEEVTHLWSDDVGLLPRLPFLRVLNIKNCDKLVSLVAEDQVEESLQLCMPSKLTKLTIDNCGALKSLPKAMMCNYMTHLEFIHITGCDSLTHFARSQLPPTLKWLYICDCKNIRKLVEEDDTNYSCSSTPSLLESLSILNCPSLEYLTSSGVLPDSLRDLNISKCPKLESGAKSFHHNLYLESIVISDCENLKFLDGGNLLPTNLRVLEISSCEKLQALPNGMNNLTSLRSLKIGNCQGIQSFPVEGFPTNLTTLAITHLKITDALLHWGLDNLIFLKELHIGGYQHLSFPEFMWPAFLTSLHISHFPNLELLNSLGFQKLGFLKGLIISECKKLTSFPLEGLPCSLVTLDINSCQKLMSFPKNGLPPTLEKLRIMGCPLLEERCKKGGSEWSKIADIPYVEVSNKFIYDLETEE